jgi:hypothetical protein
MTLPGNRLVAGRFIAIYCGERLGKFPLNQIVADNKGVGTNEITAHQAVAELVAQPLEGLEAYPEVFRQPSVKSFRDSIFLMNQAVPTRLKTSWAIQSSFLTGGVFA